MQTSQPGSNAKPLMSSRKVATPDGGHLAIYSFGTGPGVVFVEGSLTEAFVYARFARRLASAMPVHVYDRRGRGGSSPQPANYTMDDEIADLATVLEATGSTTVVGHSYGGGIKEVSLVRGSQVSAARYSGISIPVLLMFGRDSDLFYRTIAEEISSVLSNGNAVGVPRSNHGALDRPSKELMDLFVDFLVGQTQRVIDR